MNDQEKEASILSIMARYGLTRADAEVSHERRKVYGDAEANHQGIAMTLAGLLQPWALHIAAMRPLPAHVVALILCGVKLNRQRMVFHEDNFVDMTVYQSFVRTWQREYEANGGQMPELIPASPGPEYRLVMKWEKIEQGASSIQEEYPDKRAEEIGRGLTKTLAEKYDSTEVLFCYESRVYSLRSSSDGPCLSHLHGRKASDYPYLPSARAGELITLGRSRYRLVYDDATCKLLVCPTTSIESAFPKG